MLLKKPPYLSCFVFTFNSRCVGTQTKESDGACFPLYTTFNSSFLCLCTYIVLNYKYIYNLFLLDFPVLLLPINLPLQKDFAFLPALHPNARAHTQTHRHSLSHPHPQDTIRSQFGINQYSALALFMMMQMLFTAEQYSMTTFPFQH